ncbi:MAG: glycolate oxidase subunit GlcF [Gammaproteobacteria bacterium]
MQTRLSEHHRHTDYGQEANRILRKCVHCGFCNATCPTYQILGDERDGPRGRIYQIKNFLEGEDSADQLLTHLDRCLTCRACETTCPSGVEYHSLLHIGRQLAEENTQRSWLEQTKRTVILTLLPNKKLFGALMKLARFARPILPAQIKRKIPPATQKNDFIPRQHKRFVILLEGCVQPDLAPNINHATRRVLDKLGIATVSSPLAGCCGALPYHLSETEKAREMARRNIDAWWPMVKDEAESILINTSGCTPMVKDYISLFPDDSNYRNKAKRVSDLAIDISEYLAKQDLSRLTTKKPKRVAFQSPCSLQHAQQITNLVEPILKQAGFELTTISDPHLCCGSAGTYSLLQPKLSKQLRDNKLQSIEEDDPEIIATANIGCMMHLAEKATVPVKHWIELLDEKESL